MLQESHRVKVLVGALEVYLEQATIMAILRIVSSVAPSTAAESQAAPFVRSTTAMPSKPDTTTTASDTNVSDGRPQSPPVPSQRRPTAPVGMTTGEGGDVVEAIKSPPSNGAAAAPAIGAPGSLSPSMAKKDGAVAMMPMMPRGVAVTLAVDVAAVGVILTESGARVAAVTVSTANCKVNVSISVSGTRTVVFFAHALLVVVPAPSSVFSVSWEMIQFWPGGLARRQIATVGVLDPYHDSQYLSRCITTNRVRNFQLANQNADSLPAD